MSDRKGAVGFILFLATLAVGYFVFLDVKQHGEDQQLQLLGSQVRGRVIESWQPSYGLRNSAGGSKIFISKGIGSEKDWFIGSPLKEGEEVLLLILPGEGLCDREADVVARLRGWPWRSAIPFAPLIPISYALFFWLIKKEI